MDSITDMFGDGDFSMSYDEEGDVLYICFSDEEAVGSHLNDNVLVRENPETGEVVGITVMHAQKVLGPGSDTVRVPETV
ncbi:MAG: DUF2283 domain-containing protein [Candidatus Nanohaloarchaea archaeon]|nr:DUF2283 domain-containing protein [Candidatus Nanohaloarchaea archaeon]